ncbi:probable glutathione S-transferase GSTU1 [Lolium perenne]|jgi:glutathione S-transferase|uniref:probable glutathione S-transferase GSTU1 n=1 Tax=Lolium perenne TaxID=4522 RepID=UPI0021F58190|nr:probable glutathione S-transferase GSTU1 [Lolium perenne]
MAGENNVGLVLLDFWVSPFGQRCRIALAEKGLSYEYVEENIMATKSDRLLRSNPIYKQIPVLLHDGCIIIESLIILQYLDEVFPDTRSLLPTDPSERAHTRFWADYVDKKVYGCGSRLYTEKQLEAGTEMAGILKTLEEELGEKEFFGGEHGFGFVDVALMPFTTWFESFNRYWGVNVEEVAPTLAAWAARCMKRESVSKSLYSSEKVHAFISGMRKDAGFE